MSDFEKDRREILESAEKVLNKAHAIDCSLAVNYIAEFERMCNTAYEPMNGCENCPIDKVSNSTDCGTWIVNNPQKAVEIVQAWSDEHPREKVVTYLDKLLEVFPNTHLHSDGTPKGDCPSKFGLKTLNCSDSCVACWNQPYKENTNGQD